ncbi:hypothetical protein NPIL_51691 [Nephila pilipes]|uniref:Uncharacterized protein n=1 Tax=Nephila pilipes TaxID=299642 RepID=A0A8X6UBJ0_NEPPI|nr:hypothetical protein NPIL_51691 [Nephila pilipes]
MVAQRVARMDCPVKSIIASDSKAGARYPFQTFEEEEEIGKIRHEEEKEQLKKVAEDKRVKKKRLYVLEKLRIQLEL